MSRAPWRIIAQRLLTGEFLDWDVPLSQPAISRTLSGPGGINGTINPAVLDVIADDGRPVLEEWGTALYVEEDGNLRGGAIITDLSDKGPERTVTSAGFAGYPNGVPYMDDYVPANFEDPIDAFRHIWDYVQSFPDANLGLRIDATAKTWMVLSGGSGPYKINWFEDRDCGQELDNIAQLVPFDYVERHAWNADHTAITHHLDIGFPRLGRRRHDLSFEGGVNVTDVDALVRDGTRYSNDVYLLGPGEGRAMLRSRATRRDGKLRRPTVIPYKMGSQGFLDRQAKYELAARAGKVDIVGFTIKDHPNARISAIQPGDDVRLQVEVPWDGDVDVWMRVLEIAEAEEQPGQAVLKTERSEFFTYRPAKSPTGDTVVIQA